MKDRINRAEAYIDANSSKVNKRYRHTYHFQPKIGWMNDPNGFSMLNDEYHLFFQYYPYDNHFGPMHWGHAKSKDLVNWELLPIALTPSKPYDQNGIFSGCALSVGNEYRLYYTGHKETKFDDMFDENLLKKETTEAWNQIKESKVQQVQCLATSTDGLTFTKSPMNPVLDLDQIPEGASLTDFRDPKVWIHEDKFYMIVGSKLTTDVGQVLFYTSEDGVKWEYLNSFSLGVEYGCVYECPDLFRINGVDVLVISPQNTYRKGNLFENCHSSIALIGCFNYPTGDFAVEKVQELDGGFDFYAPQSILDHFGRRIMIGWMNMWERNNYLDTHDHGWNGSMSFPRELNYKEGHLYQKPVDEIKNYYKDQTCFEQFVVNKNGEHPKLVGKSFDLAFDYEFISATWLRIKLFADGNESLDIVIDKTNNEVRLERWRTENKCTSKGAINDFTRTYTIKIEGKLSLRILADVSSVEVFLNNGEYVMSSLFFGKNNGENILFKADGDVEVIHFKLRQLVM